MATPINAPRAGEIWHLSIEDLFQQVQEAPRLGGDGPFVINLSVSTAPISVPTKPFSSCPAAHVYQIQVNEDGRTRYRLRVGPFASEDEADSILADVRDVYPAALTATASAPDLRVIESLQAKIDARLAAARRAAEPVVIAKPAEKPVAEKTVIEKAAALMAVAERAVEEKNARASQRSAPPVTEISAEEHAAEISIEIVLPPVASPTARAAISGVTAGAASVRPAAPPVRVTAPVAHPKTTPVPVAVTAAEQAARWELPELDIPLPHVSAARPMTVAPVLTEVVTPVRKQAATKLTPPKVAGSKIAVSSFAPVLTDVVAPQSASAIAPRTEAVAKAAAVPSVVESAQKLELVASYETAPKVVAALPRLELPPKAEAAQKLEIAPPVAAAAPLLTEVVAPQPKSQIAAAIKAAARPISVEISLLSIAAVPPKMNTTPQTSMPAQHAKASAPVSPPKSTSLVITAIPPRVVAPPAATAPPALQIAAALPAAAKSAPTLATKAAAAPVPVARNVATPPPPPPKTPIMTQSVASPARAGKHRGVMSKPMAARLTSLQHVVVATTAAPATREVKKLDRPLESLESTQTVRALTVTELEDEATSRWFVIQLAMADKAFDPDAVPNLDLFSEYRLYSVAGLDQGRVVHALRLGFFREEIAAVAVASYLGSFWDKPTIKRISLAERERFADQRVEARKDVGGTGKHAVIEITDELVARRKRSPKSPGFSNDSV